mmetsp:Transcript_35741/g.111564  ORF Transcript_35741/g.111564 Transcript_35741/m.111564 type:complete len:82 (+) Transcript_35741:207-452(+)
MRAFLRHAKSRGHLICSDLLFHLKRTGQFMEGADFSYEQTPDSPSAMRCSSTHNRRASASVKEDSRGLLRSRQCVGILEMF